MTTKIYRVLRFKNVPANTLDVVNSLRKNVEVDVKFAQKKIKENLIPDDYRTVEYSLEDFDIESSTLEVTSDGKSTKFVPKNVVGEFRHRDIWKNKKKTIIKPRSQVFAEFKIPVVFFIKDGYLHAMLLRANDELLKKFKILYTNAVELEPESFDNSLFNWLFFLFNKKNKVIDGDNKILDMLGFSSTPYSKELDLELITGMSSNVSSLDATKLELALRHILRSIKLTLEYNNRLMEFAIDDRFKMVIEPQHSDVSAVFSKNFKGFESIHEAMARGIYVVCVILPYLEVQYEGFNNFENEFEAYRKELSSTLIKRLKEAY